MLTYRSVYCPAAAPVRLWVLLAAGSGAEWCACAFCPHENAGISCIGANGLASMRPNTLAAHTVNSMNLHFGTRITVCMRNAKIARFLLKECGMGSCNIGQSETPIHDVTANRRNVNVLSCIHQLGWLDYFFCYFSIMWTSKSFRSPYFYHSFYVLKASCNETRAKEN